MNPTSWKRFIPLADATIDMLAELWNYNIADALDAFEDVEREYKKYGDVIVAWRKEG